VVWIDPTAIFLNPIREDDEDEEEKLTGKKESGVRAPSCMEMTERPVRSRMLRSPKPTGQGNMAVPSGGSPGPLFRYIIQYINGALDRKLEG
jgi:hypothetical protein